MNNNTPMKVLVVDDVSTVLDVVIAYFDWAGEDLGVTAEVRFAPDVEMLKAIVDRGERFDVTLVDLGLGKGNPSGLSALDLLHRRDGAGGRVAVHANLADTNSRLLLAFAAFQWFSDMTVALIPKVGSAEGESSKARAKDFVQKIILINQGKVPEPDKAAPFRQPRHGNDNYFSELIRTPEDLRNFKTMQIFNSFGEAAKAAHLTESLLANWGTGRRRALEQFMREVSKHRDLAGLIVKPIPENQGGHTTAAIISQFAEAQHLFFDDPAVASHFN